MLSVSSEACCKIKQKTSKLARHLQKSDSLKIALGKRAARLIPIVMLVLLHCLFSCEVAAAENCAGLSAAEQQKCDDTMKALSASRTTSLKGDWRLVRTTNPNGGADAVSIIHTSDTAKSDINLAGLTFRCGKLGIDAVLVLLTSLPLQLRPMVSLKDGSNTKEFEASVIQGGEAILLPPEASKMISSPEWQADPELSVEIKTHDGPIKGSIPISGLTTAFQTLSQTCGPLIGQ